MRSTLFGAALYLTSASVALAADFSVIRLHLDVVKEPQSILEGGMNILKSPEGQAALQALAATSGLPPGAIRAGGLIAGAMSKPSSDETRMRFSYEPGWTFCRVHKTARISDTGGAVLSGTAQTHDMGFYAHTRQNAPTGGRTWIEGEVEIVTVRQDRAAHYRSAGHCVPLKGNDFEVRIIAWRGKTDEQAPNTVLVDR